MVLKRVIPCLDVDRGRVVKGTNFVDIRDAGDPVELAARYQDEGADEIVFLDITASHERRETAAALARRCADEVFIPFTIGGGIRSAEDAQAVLDAGSDKVSVNSAAVARPELVGELAEVFGAQCVVLAIDARARAGRLGLRGGGPGRARRDRARGGRVGARGRRPRGGGDPADEHGPRRHRGRLRAGAHPAGGGRGGRAGDRLGRRGELDHLVDAVERAAPTPCCAPRSSTTAGTRCARPRSGMAAAGHSRAASERAARPLAVALAVLDH